MTATVLTAPLSSREVKARSQEICNKFHEVGLMAVVPAQAPIATNVFSMGLDASSEVFRFWTGAADVKIIDVMSDPKKQVIVRVAEDKHKLVIPFTVRTSRDNIKYMSPSRYVQTNFPKGTTLKFSPKFEFIADKRQTNVKEQFGLLKREVIVSVPTFDNTFLMGYDEVKCFISQLPRHVSTVVAAHKLLRPAHLLKTSLRQGEWFFTPCSKAEIATVQARILVLEQNSKSFSRDRAEHTQAINTVKTQSMPIVSGSSHRALQRLDDDGTVYVRGFVVDHRNGRHTALELKDWHRVTRNNEVAETTTTNGSPQPVRVRWD